MRPRHPATFHKARRRRIPPTLSPRARAAPRPSRSSSPVPVLAFRLSPLRHDLDARDFGVDDRLLDIGDDVAAPLLANSAEAGGRLEAAALPTLRALRDASPHEPDLAVLIDLLERHPTVWIRRP